MSEINTSWEIGPLKIKNRLVRSATAEGCARPDGSVTAPLIEEYRCLAAGGVGLIISGFMYVSLEGRTMVCQTGAHEDRLIDGLSNIADAVHKEGGKIFAQLAHGGRQCRKEAVSRTLAPSPVYEPATDQMPEEMDESKISETIEKFVMAAKRAAAAGFDGVQIHGAHGYLISSFNSPHTNRRKDEWGGKTGGRARFVCAVIKGIKDKLGQDFPVSVKHNASDILENGLYPDESAIISKMIEKAGADMIEFSAGMMESGKTAIIKRKINSPEKEAYFREYADIAGKGLRIPKVLTGGIRSVSVIEGLLESGYLAAGMARPFIHDPGVASGFVSGEKDRSSCKSCLLCTYDAGAGNVCGYAKRRGVN